ncbi:unnamed protein product [Coffea canephora]|uniref:DH200=94 genomic scaffold, scaffold_670 n=1 Tax=Coffea canephora TaxID=49390 RepID=A0A068VGD9_COFCA|nr:unnamed protein product [Coffea canephora]
MAVISQKPGYISTATTAAAADPLLPWLWSIEKALIHETTSDLEELLSNCIKTCSNDPRYKNDVRFLKIWFLHMDRSSDHESVFREMEKNKICSSNCFLYEWYALFLEAKGKLIDAYFIYHLGISRNAEPIGRLKKAQVLFLERVSDIVMIVSVQKVVKYIISKVVQVREVSLKYLKAHVDCNPDDVVALKVSKTLPFPREFYMYRLLNMHIPESERMNFGFAHQVHLYSDYSILVSDYLAHGTLQDAINSNLVTNVAMEEELSIYYTI